jgi:insertion element IS1 protein InsB
LIWKKNIEIQTEEIEYLELDEMWSFVGSKENKCWIWLALDRVRKRIVGFVTGTRGKKTGRKLWDKIQNIPVCNYVSDDWEAYQDFIPKDKHLIGKQYTNSIEGFNSNFRLFLKRLNRRTKCYSKSQEMLDNCLKLYIHRFNLIYSC